MIAEVKVFNLRLCINNAPPSVFGTQNTVNQRYDYEEEEEEKSLSEHTIANFSVRARIHRLHLHHN